MGETRVTNNSQVAQLKQAKLYRCCENPKTKEKHQTSLKRKNTCQYEAMMQPKYHHRKIASQHNALFGPC